MKAGWETATLGDVCELIARGVAPKYVETGGVIVLNQKCVRDHRVNFDFGRRHDDSQRAVREDRLLKSGDVLVNSTGTGTLGRVAQLRAEPSQPMTVDTHVTIVRPKPAKFDPCFFGYMMIQIEEQLAASGEGASGQTELARSTLADNFEVSYPISLDEQRRIVAVLDTAFAGIATATANARKNLTNARALFESCLENTFSEDEDGWESKPFSELCTIKHGFAFKSEFFAPDGDYVLLTPGNFLETGGYRDRGAKQKFYTGAVPSDFVLEEGDLLVAMTEQADGLLGSPIIVPDSATFLHNQRLGLVKPKHGVSWCNEFFFHAFNSKAVRLTLRKTATGAKVRHTSPTKIGDVKIAVPSNEMQQQQVAAKLTALEFQASELANIQMRKLAALAELKQSLLKKAFAGELTQNFATPQGTAQIMAFAYWLHKKHNRDLSYKHVKAQKCLQQVESVGRIELGRQPIKDAAGPNDFLHMLRAEEWAEAQGFFRFVPSTNGPGYDFKKLANYDALWPDAVAATKPIAADLERAIMPLVPMDKEGAELFATVHAAWNNLICDGATITDDAIIKEARDDWHADKFNIPEHKFREAIKLIRAKNLEPDGTSKYVGGQVKLL